MIPIHRIVLRRLLLAWLVLSLLGGGLTYWYGRRTIDAAIIALAAEQSARFAPEELDTGAYDAETLRLLRDRAAAFIEHNFVEIEIFDRHDRPVMRLTNPDYAGIASRLREIRRDFPHDRHSHFEQIASDEPTLVQLLVPLPGRTAGEVGYFGGIFVVDRETRALLHAQARNMLGTMLLAIFVTSLALYPLIIALNRQAAGFARKVLQGNLEIASVLGVAIAKRDSETGSHNYRVTLNAVEFAEKLGLPDDEIGRLMLGAFLHDVGKIGISDRILLKAGPLDADEQAIMHSHVMLGIEIIAQSEWLQGAREVIAGHHEKWDGSGYPLGLKNTEIPLKARIFSIVDVFDALTSHRPYKEAMSLAAALAVIRAGSGSHFDPALVERFIDMAPALHAATGSAGDAELQARLRTFGERYATRAAGRGGIAA